MLREDTLSFDLRAPSICSKHHRRLATAIPCSLVDSLQTNRKPEDYLCKLPYNKRRYLSWGARQLISIYSSKFHLMKQGKSLFYKDLDTAISFERKILFFMQIVITRYKSTINEMWGNVDDPGGLGRRKAPNFGLEHTHLGPPSPPDAFLSSKNASDVSPLP